MSFYDGAPTPDQEARDHAFFVHLITAAIALFSASLLIPLAGPLVGYLLDKRRDKFVLFHMNQAFFFQLLVNGTTLAGGVLIAVLSFCTCGIGVILLWPLAIVIGVIIWLASFGYPVYQAIRARDGHWERAPIVGDWVAAQDSPLFG